MTRQDIRHFRESDGPHRTVQLGLGLAVLLGALFIFPWSTGPGQPRGLEVSTTEIPEDADLFTSMLWIRTWSPGQISLPDDHFEIDLILTTNPLSKAPEGGLAHLLFEDGTDVVNCPGCTYNNQISDDNAPPELRWEVTSVTTPLRWQETDCGTPPEDPAKTCFVGTFDNIEVLARKPFLVSEGAGQARVRTPAITFNTEPESTRVVLPLSSRYVGVEGIAPTLSAFGDWTSWQGAPEDFEKAQYAQAELPVRAWREARIFAAGLLGAVALEQLISATLGGLPSGESKGGKGTRIARGRR